MEDPYRERARAEILERIERGRPSEWFNLNPHPELGDRTVSEAWHAGDHEAVIAWLDEGLAASQRAAERHRNDPEFMAMIRAVAAKSADNSAA